MLIASALWVMISEWNPLTHFQPGTSADASSTKDQAGMANAFSEIDEDGDGKLRRWGRIRKHVFLKVQNKSKGIALLIFFCLIL